MSVESELVKIRTAKLNNIKLSKYKNFYFLYFTTLEFSSMNIIYRFVGIDSRFFDRGSPPEDVTCVDLDTNMITQLVLHFIGCFFLRLEYCQIWRQIFDFLYCSQGNFVL